LISEGWIEMPNLYLYFGLEMKNTAAMRVMAYEPRLIGLEIARDDAPVWLGVPDVLSSGAVMNG
jgi:hypothetical protein